MTESTPPPPESGGGARYALLGLLLLLGAGGIYFLMSSGEGDPPPVAATLDAGIVQRPVMEPILEIPDEEPDAGPQDAGQPEETMTAMRPPQPRECNGELTQQQILSVVGPARSQVRQCYERRLKVNNVLQGTVNVSVLVDRDGTIDQMRVGGSLRDPEVFACVRRIVDGWRFPAPSGGCVQVNVPFALSPQQ